MSIEEEIKDIERQILTIRSHTIRKLLKLYLYAHALTFIWVGEYPNDVQDDIPSLSSTRTFLQCSERTARDYKKAYQLIIRISNASNAFMANLLMNITQKK